MPPDSFHSLTASLAPLSSQAPSELSWPLWASTRAILIGPVALPDDWVVLPGALHATIATAAAARVATVTRRRVNRDMTFHLDCEGTAGQLAGSPRESRHRHLAVLGRHPDWSVGRAVSVIATHSLHDLEEDPSAEGRRVEVEELAIPVPVIKDSERAHDIESRAVEVEAGRQIVVVVAGNREQRQRTR